MATDQGKNSNMNGLAIASNAVGKVPPSVGLTTVRPPYTPTTFGVFAGYNRGPLFEVTRRAPIDAWAEENGAVFEPVSLWRRAWYFPKPGERSEEHTSELQSLMRISYAVFCLKKKNTGLPYMYEPHHGHLQYH